MSMSDQLDAPRPLWRRIGLVLGFFGLLSAMVVPVLLQSWARESPAARGGRAAASVVAASMAVALLGGIVFYRAWPGIVRGLGNQGLATIGLLSGLHFAVSYASVIAGYAIGAVLGPFYVFVAGVTDEGVPKLLLAVLVVLLPRRGVVALSMLTVFALNGVVSGQFGLISVLFVSASIVLNEGLLAMFGITTRIGSARAGINSRASLIARVALAIGLANGAKMYVQYCLFELLYRLEFAAWYVVAVTLVPGLLYGTIGAALGAALGLRLRRTAP